MVPLARLPGPKAPAPAFIASRSATAPCTMARHAHGCVVVCMPKRLNVRLVHRRRRRPRAPACTQGRQPAMTAFAASSRVVSGAPRGASCRALRRVRAPRSAQKRSTRSAVGTTIGSPSVQPQAWSCSRSESSSPSSGRASKRSGPGRGSDSPSSRACGPVNARITCSSTSAVTRSRATDRGNPADRMGDDGQAEIAGVALLEHLAREAIELVLADAAHGQPPGREFDQVVATPRRARASIEAGDDAPHRSRARISSSSGAVGAERGHRLQVTPRDDPEALVQQLLQPLEHDGGVRLVVGEEADGLAREVVERDPQRPCSGAGLPLVGLTITMGDTRLLLLTRRARRFARVTRIPLTLRKPNSTISNIVRQARGPDDGLPADRRAAPPPADGARVRRPRVRAARREPGTARSASPSPSSSEQMIEMGLYGMTLPEPYGGGGQDLLDGDPRASSSSRASRRSRAAGRVREQRRPGARHRALRHDAQKDQLAAAGLPRRDGDLDRHERARGRQRAHRPAHQGREGRRRLEAQRRQGLVHRRRPQPRVSRLLPHERSARARRASAGSWSRRARPASASARRSASSGLRGFPSCA